MLVPEVETRGFTFAEFAIVLAAGGDLLRAKSSPCWPNRLLIDEFVSDSSFPHDSTFPPTALTV
jgi:hypothetical protein